MPYPSQHRVRRWETGAHARFLTFSRYRRMALLGSPALWDMAAASNLLHELG